MTEQLALGRSLRGKFVRFHHESKTSQGHLVVGIAQDGMIELADMSGLFAPSLFERIDRPHSAAEGNC